LVGPEGVGKKTLVLMLAAIVNCKNPKENAACGRCPSCVQASSSAHPDIRLYQPEKDQIRIEPMRELSREAHFRPFEGEVRFFIIDGAERMNENAANSILKTMEEPPETSRLVLITHLPHKLLATIRSRCQIFSFQSLGRKEIESYLSQRGGEENLMMRAAFAGGSIGRALSLDLEETLSQRDLMLDLMISWSRTESFEELYRTCEGSPLRLALKKREKVKEYLDVLESLSQDIYFMMVGTPERVVSCDQMDRLEQLSQSLELNWIRGFLYHIGQSRWEIDHFLNPLICFETLWLLNSRKNSDAGYRYGQI